MSQLILMVAKVDDLDNPEALTEVWRRAMPIVDPNNITPGGYLDGLENTVTDVGCNISGKEDQGVLVSRS